MSGKNVTQCAKEMGVTRKTLHGYKNSSEFRQMAIEHLEDSKLGGLLGTVTKLVGALDAKKPIVIDCADGSTKVKMVADQKTRMIALQEVIKIYGLHAPIRKDVTASISISSDDELFDEIEGAERASRFVESYQEGPGGLELVASKSSFSKTDVASRGRTILQDDAIPESE